MDTRGAVDLARMRATHDFRRSELPALGPAFGHSTYDPNLITMPGGATLMFDLNKLTLSDYRAMRWHPQVNASMSLMMFMFHQLDWKIECERPEIAAMVEENMRLIWTRLIRAVVSQALWAGYSPCILEWENESSGRWVFLNKIKDLLPEECEVNWKEVDSSYQPPEPAQKLPKVKIYDGIKRFGLSSPIPTELSFWYPLLMENGDYYGRKLLKAAFTPWYFSLLIHLFANRYFERFGEPLPIGRAPFDDDFKFFDPVQNKTVVRTGKQVMEDALMSLRSRAIVTLPSDRDETASSGGGRSEYLYDIEYLESQMRGADFERYLARLDEEIALSIFTPMLLMRTGDVGSHNLGVQHTQTWLWSLNAIAGDFKEYFDRYIIRRMVDVNFSPNAPDAYWVPRKMGKDNPESLRAALSAVISSRLATPDLEELGVALGLKLNEVKQLMDKGEGELVTLSGNVAHTLSTPTPVQAPTDQRNRSERDRSSASGPRRVGEPLSTSREIAARIRGQVANNWQADRFGKANLSLGFRRKFEESLVSDGWTPAEAADATFRVYGRMERWLEFAKSFGIDEYGTVDDFMSMFEARLITEIESLAAS